jgi:hypothetical protein
MINNQTNNRADLNSVVALGQALQRLEKNEDFLAVIKDDYIMRTLIVESQGMLDQSPPMRQEALEKIQSVNYFRQYLTTIKNNAQAALEELNGGDLDE